MANSWPAEEQADIHSHRKKHRHHFHTHAQLLSSKQTSKSESKDVQGVSKQHVAKLPPAPLDSKGACLQIFGNRLSLTDWKVIQRQWPAMYLMLFLSFSLLGMLSSPFFFVISLLDHFRYNRAAGADVFQALYIGGPRLVRTFSFSIVFLVIAGFYSYTFFFSDGDHRGRELSFSLSMRGEAHHRWPPWRPHDSAGQFWELEFPSYRHVE